jgi:poly-D-alanine transfer protein DltD
MPLTIRTIRDAHEEGYRINGTCKCGWSGWIDLAKLIEEGLGDEPISKDFRHSCGRVADVRLHPPAPKR